DGAVQEHDQGNTYARERFPVHRQGNGRSPAAIVLGMAAFFGFHMPTFTFRGVSNDRLFDRVVENAKAAERAGFDLVTVMDHLYQIRGIGPETEPMMEAYTTLSALATQTSRVKLGTLVTGVTYRNPALLLLAQHGDSGHWFDGNLEDLKRQKQGFEQHCEALHRDPSEVLLTVGLTLVLAENEKDARALMGGLSPERRAMAQTATVAEA